MQYWITQHKCGYFDPYIPVEQPKKYRAVTERDSKIVQETLRVKNEQSCRDVMKVLQKDGYSLSISTTQRLIKDCGFTSSKPRYSQMVRQANKEKRVEFRRKLIICNDSLDNVIFSDESSFQLNNNRVTVYRKENCPANSIPRAKHPLKLHVWAGISRRGVTKLVVFEGIMDSEFFTNTILKEALVPFVKHNFPTDHRFQQDNDPKHKSRLAKNFIVENGINHWDVWPSGKFLLYSLNCEFKGLNSLPDDRILGFSKMKAFADDKIKVTEKLKFVL